MSRLKLKFKVGDRVYAKPGEPYANFYGLGTVVRAERDTDYPYYVKLDCDTEDPDFAWAFAEAELSPAERSEYALG